MTYSFPLISSHTVKTGTEKYAMHSLQGTFPKERRGWLSAKWSPKRETVCLRLVHSLLEIDSLRFLREFLVLGNLGEGKGKVHTYTREKLPVGQKNLCQGCFLESVAMPRELSAENRISSKDSQDEQKIGEVNSRECFQFAGTFKDPDQI